MPESNGHVIQQIKGFGLSVKVVVQADPEVDNAAIRKAAELAVEQALHERGQARQHHPSPARQQYVENQCTKCGRVVLAPPFAEPGSVACQICEATQGYEAL